MEKAELKDLIRERIDSYKNNKFYKYGGEGSGYSLKLHAEIRSAIIELQWMLERLEELR